MADNPNCLSSTPFTGIPMVPDTGYPIHIGDLLFQDPNTKKARSVASMIDQGSKTLNQQTLHDLFAGVALQRGGELESGEVSFDLNPLPPQLIVAGGGMFLFGCAATAWQPGDWVGAVANTAGTGLKRRPSKRCRRFERHRHRRAAAQRHRPKPHDRGRAHPVEPAGRHPDAWRRAAAAERCSVRCPLSVVRCNALTRIAAENN